MSYLEFNFRHLSIFNVLAPIANCYFPLPMDFTYHDENVNCLISHIAKLVAYCLELNFAKRINKHNAKFLSPFLEIPGYEARNCNERIVSPTSDYLRGNKSSQQPRVQVNGSLVEHETTKKTGQETPRETEHKEQETPQKTEL